VVVFLILIHWPHHPCLVEEVAVDLCSVQCTICHLHLDEVTLEEIQTPAISIFLKRVISTHDSTRFCIGAGFGTAQGAQDGEGGGQMLEGVSLGATASHVKQLAQQEH